jgi:DNA-directed RNA polymerase subunit RPC12/RpoP
LCGKELPKQFQASGECPYCKAKPGSKPGAGTWSGGPLVTGIFVCIFLLLAGTHLVLFLRERKKTETTDNEPSAYYHCPKCKRKIRYKVSLAGRAGRCPTCSKPILFPPIN